MKTLKPYTLDFVYDNQNYRLILKQYGFTLEKERQLEVLEGALGLADLGVSPTTYEKVENDPYILRSALSRIKNLPKSERSKISKRDTGSIIKAIDPTAEWNKVLRVQNAIGVI